jgi:hypothetical protein
MPTLMHSKHVGPVASVTSRLTQPSPTTLEPSGVDSVETEEGWKKVEGKRWKGKREMKVVPAGHVPTWADILRGGGVRVTVFIGGGAGYTKPKARRPAEKRKKQQGQLRPASSSIAGREGGCLSSCLLFPCVGSRRRSRAERPHQLATAGRR